MNRVDGSRNTSYQQLSDMLNNSKDRGQEGQGIDAYFASFQGPQSPKLELIKETSADLKLTQAFQDS